MNIPSPKKNQCSEGFTLIELLVVTAIFSILVLLLAILFINGTTLQSRAFNKQAVYDDSAFIFEKIARDIIPSGVVTNDTGGCFDLSQANVLELNSWVYGHVYYYAQIDADGNKKIERQQGITGQPGTFTQELSSNKVKMTGLKYCVRKPVGCAGQATPICARVTLLGTFTSINQSPGVTYKLQTSIVQRTLGPYSPDFVSL